MLKKGIFVFVLLVFILIASISCTTMVSYPIETEIEIGSSNSEYLNLEDIDRDIIRNSNIKFHTLRQKTKLVCFEVHNYLEDYFHSLGATVDTTQRSHNVIHIEVSDLRGEIIDSSKYWETLEIIVFIAIFDEVEIVTMINGGIASGFRPPRPRAYRNMEYDYNHEMLSYLGNLNRKIVDHLSGGEET